MARLRGMEWGCGRAPGGPDGAEAPVGDGGKSGGRPGNDGSVAGRLPAGRDGWKADGQSRDVPERSGKPCRHLHAPFLPGFWLGGRFFRRIRAGSACTRCRALRQMARCASDLQPADAVPVCQGRVPDQVRVRTVLRMTCMCKKITQTGRRFRHACHTERRRSDEAASGRPGAGSSARQGCARTVPPRECRSGRRSVQAPHVGTRDQRLLSRKAVSWPLETAPTLVPTSVPFLNSISVGMPRMPYLAAMAWLSSTLTLATAMRSA